MDASGALDQGLTKLYQREAHAQEQKEDARDASPHDQAYRPRQAYQEKIQEAENLR